VHEVLGVRGEPVQPVRAANGRWLPGDWVRTDLSCRTRPERAHRAEFDPDGGARVRRASHLRAALRYANAVGRPGGCPGHRRRHDWSLCRPGDEDHGRGYDSALTTERCHSLGVTDIVCAKKKRSAKKQHKGEAKPKKPLTLGLRWPVERTNSWFSNFGQLRRNTDRFSTQRLGQIALAVALILTVKLVKWAKRWTD
jgi:hypothetical protein